MRRAALVCALGLLTALADLAAQEGIAKGTIKAVDAKKDVITLTVGDRDQDFKVTPATRFMTGNGTLLKEGINDKSLEPGAAVAFKAKDGVLIGLRLAGPGKIDTSALVPLSELGDKEYRGFKGGLYPEGKNERPAAHEAAGIALAKRIRPLDRDGKPADGGKVVLLSVGMSNTTQVFSVFKKLADADKEKNPRLAIVDGAQGAMTALRISDPDSGSGAKFWAEVDRRLEAAGVTRAQVQAAWIKQADAGPSEGFPAYAQQLQARLAKIVQLMHARFPNLKLVYLSGRTYGGYAKTPLNPEPYAYESGFSVKWLIEQQLKGEPALNHDPAKGKVTAPWLSWGPELWANGTTKRADGFFWEAGDFAKDGTHPSPVGQRKAAELLLRFFKADTTARPWFVAVK